MMMKKYITSSVKIVNANIIFVLLLAFPAQVLPLSSVSLLQGTEVTNQLLLVGIIGFAYQLFVSFIIIPIIYGRFVEIATRRHSVTPYMQIYKKNAINFYIAYLTLYIPYYFLLYLAKLIFTMHSEMMTLIATILKIVFDMAIIYVFPLVFIKKMSITAVNQGIAVLLKNFKKSWLLLFMTLISSIMAWIIVYIFKDSSLYAQNNKWLLILSFSYVINFMSIYVHFIIFITVSLFLFNELNVNEITVEIES